MFRALIISCTATAALAASAETLRLPCKYVETSYTVHRLTGLTSDEKSKDKVLPRPLEVLKIKDGAGDGVQFTAKNRGGIDKSEDESVTVSPDEAKEIVEALGKFAEMTRAASSARQNASTELVNIDDDLAVTFVTTNSGRKSVIEFAVGDSVFVLGKLECEKLAAAIKKAK